MKSPNLLFRRTHLYLGMLLLPWVALYGLSTVVLNHREHFEQVRPANQAWDLQWEKDYAVEVPTGQEALRETAKRVLAENGIDAAFGVQRQGARLLINVPNFRQPTRLIYDAGQKKLRAETRTNSWAERLVRMHERTGYGRGGFLNNLWAFIVDLFCVTTLVWIATGLYLWWKIAPVRRWGFVTLGAGVATIAVLLATL